MKTEETKAINDAFSFLAMICQNFEPKDFRRAMVEIRRHCEVLRDLCNKDVANHFADLCHMRIGEVLVKNDIQSL